MMDLDELRGRLRARPFEPFALRMADGRLFDVREPARLAVSPKGTTLLYWTLDDVPVFLPPGDVLTTAAPDSAGDGRAADGEPS